MSTGGRGGEWVGVWGKREKKSVKTAVYPSRNDCEMLKLCKSKLFQRGNFIIVSIFNTRGIFRTRSNIYDGRYLGKISKKLHLRYSFKLI